MARITEKELKKVKGIASARIAAARESGKIKTDKDRMSLIKQLNAWNGIDMAYDLRDYLPIEQTLKKLGLPIQEKTQAASSLGTQPQSRVPSEGTSDVSRETIAKTEVKPPAKPLTNETITPDIMANKPVKEPSENQVKSPETLATAEVTATDKPATDKTVSRETLETISTQSNPTDVTTAGHGTITEPMENSGMEKEDSPPLEDLSYRLEGFDKNCDSYDFCFSPNIPPCQSLEEFGLQGYPIDQEKPDPVWYSGENDSYEHCFNAEIPPVLSPRDYDYSGISEAPPHPIEAYIACLEGSKTTECNPINDETKPDDGTVEFFSSDVSELIDETVDRSVTEPVGEPVGEPIKSELVEEKPKKLTSEVNETVQEAGTEPKDVLDVMSTDGVDTEPTLMKNASRSIRRIADDQTLSLDNDDNIVLTDADIADIRGFILADRAETDYFPANRYDAIELELKTIECNNGCTNDVLISDDLRAYVNRLRGGNKFLLECRPSMLEPELSIPWDGDYVSEAVLKKLKCLNEKFATINIGEQNMVLSIAPTRTGYRLWDYKTFKGKLLPMGKAPVGKKDIPYSDLWLSWPGQRSIHGGLIFAPDKASFTIVEHDLQSAYNTFRGFGCKPISRERAPGIGKLVDRMERFILEHVCSNDKEMQQWIIDWIGFMVQKPAVKVVTSMVWRGTHGTGKNTLADIILYIVGSHGRMLQNENLLFGTFNTALENNLIMFLNEFSITRDCDLRKLKAYCSDPVVNIETKHKTAYVANNFSRFVALTNKKSAFPLEQADRRTNVFNFDFVFKDKKNEAEAKELSFMFPQDSRFKLVCGVWFDDLLKRDLRHFDPQGLPIHNDARADAMIENLTSVENWLCDITHNGYACDGFEQFSVFTEEMTSAALYNCYIHYCKQLNITSDKRRASNKFMEGAEEKYHIVRSRNNTGRWCYTFPNIDQFEKILTVQFKLPKGEFK